MQKRIVFIVASFFATYFELGTTLGQDSALKLVQREKVHAALTFELRQSPAEAYFVLIGLEDAQKFASLSQDDFAKIFWVSVHHPNDATPRPSLLGTYRVDKGELRFESRFPLSPNAQYLLVFDESEWNSRVSTKSFDAKQTLRREYLFSPFKSELAPAAKVVNIFPSAAELPENVLKFYIHFSAPMSRGEAYERVHLFCEDKEVESPFLELGEELWDAEQTRFTLFIHPGRIKRGVKPREEDGLPLAEGKSYQLVVDQDWKGADRQKLQSRFVKSFRATVADDEQPDPTKWKLTTPKLNSQEPVSIQFNEPLDHAMLNRVLVVKNDANIRVEGELLVSENETLWQFKPSVPWRKGDYSIEVATNLEDLAGNSLARPFESKLRNDTVGVQSVPRIAIQFTLE